MRVNRATAGTGLKDFVKPNQKRSTTNKKSPGNQKNRAVGNEQSQQTEAPTAPLRSVAPEIRDHRPDNGYQLLQERKRLFLRVGDEVTHVRYEEWGIGVVMECMTSSVPGGTCLTRIRFQDGQLRCFNNDLDNESCCYYFGVRRYWNPTDGVSAVRTKFFLRG